MFTKIPALIVAGMTAAILTTGSASAAKISVSDDIMASIYGSANDTTFNGDTNATNSANNDGTNIQAAAQPHSDSTSNGQYQNFTASNQSGAGSQVQQNISGLNNALPVGSVSQNAVINTSGSVGGTMNVYGYALVARGDF